MNIDAIIVFGYLIITLIYGLYVGRGVKNINDYALGGRDFTTPVLAATIFATKASSSGFYISVTKGYEDGMYNLLASLGQVIGLLFMAYFVSPRIKEFFGKLSVSEMMGDVYGRNARIISSVPLFLKSAGFVAIQMKVLSSMLEYFSGLDNFTAILLTSIVVISYSAFGGIKAVTFTDFVQFATFGIAIPVIFFSVFFSIDFESNPSKKVDLLSHMFNFEESKFDYYSMLFIYFAVPSLSGTMTQRMLMAKNVNQINESMTIAATLVVVIFVLSNFIGFFIHVDNPNLLPKEVLPYLIDNYTSYGLKGLLIVGIIAMAMSTADSNLNVGSISFSHDFCRPLGLVSDKNELMLSKVFTLICGGLGILLALKFQDLISLILFVGGFYLSVVSVPMLLALFGFRSSERAVLTGMAFGVITVMFWESGMKSLGFENPISSFLPGMFAHMIGLFGAHYLLGEKGGWGQGPGSGPFNSPPKDFWGKNTSITARNLRKESRPLLYNRTNFKRSFFNLLTKNLPQSRYLYNSLAFLNISLYSLAFIYLGDEQNQSLMLLLGVLLTSFFLLMRNLLTDRNGYILLPIYFISIVYSYPFLSSYLLFETHFSLHSVILVFVSITVIQVLMTSQFAFVANISGFTLASIFFVKSTGLMIALDLIAKNCQLIFFIFISFFLIKTFLFKANWRYIISLLNSNEILREDKEQLGDRLKGSEESIKRLHDLKTEILNNFSHEVRTPLMSAGNYLDIAISKFQDSDVSSHKLSYLSSAKENFEKLKSYILRLTDLSEYQKGKMIYDIKNENILNLLKEIPSSYINKIDISLNFPRKLDGLKLNFDVLKIKQAIEEIISNSINHAKSSKIDIYLLESETSNNLEIIIKDYSNDLDSFQSLKEKNRKNEIEKIFQEFEITGDGNNGYRGLGLALVREIMKTHGGNASAKLYEEKSEYGLEIKLEFPLHKTNVSIEEDKRNEERNLSRKLKILLVDDDENILKSTGMILEYLGHEVYLVSGGVDAVNFIETKKENIDVILLDIMMPDMSGIEVLEKVWKILKKNKVKTVIQSGVGIIEEYQNILKNYENIIYINKPYSQNQLMDVIYT